MRRTRAAGGDLERESVGEPRRALALEPYRKRLTVSSPPDERLPWIVRKYWRIIRYALRQWPMLLGIAVFSCRDGGGRVLSPWPLKISSIAPGGDPTPAWVTRSWATFGLQPTGARASSPSPPSPVWSDLPPQQHRRRRALPSVGPPPDSAWSTTSPATSSRGCSDLSLLFHGKTPGRRFAEPPERRRVVRLHRLRRRAGSAGAALLTLTLVGSVAWRLDAKLAAVAFAVAAVLGGSAYFFGRRLRRANENQSRSPGPPGQFRPHHAGRHPAGAGLQRRDAATSTTYHRLPRRRPQHPARLGTQAGLRRRQHRRHHLGTASSSTWAASAVLAGAMTLGSLLVFLAYLRTIQAGPRRDCCRLRKLKVSKPSIDRVAKCSTCEGTARVA